MKWQGRRKSSNIEDRRGQSGGGFNFGGSGGRGGISPMLLAPLLKMLFSKTGLIIVGGLILVMWLTGTNPLALLSQFTGGPSTQMAAGDYKASPEEEQLAEFTAVVLADTEDVWNQLMNGYREPSLVLFTGQVNSACGNASAATGPFYCPGDEKVYIDLSFFQDMGRKLGAHGDFAQAYVIAHEVGHHVQRLDGTLERVQSKRGKLPEAEFNRLMVMLELQADFYAGVWAHHTQRINNSLEPGDIDEALNAASSVGDDRLQKQATGRVVPDSFTHGTSEQRSRWFKLGFDTGDVTQGDTFNARRL
ncbi:neutral zinc metallopeptidase [Aquiflexum sp. TKW24L]|uniref:KPN_02809 family neutral zinc metallopeptidase n=1 Tax=Aquiflexum sp. TKW24L TaxID=2942212 RepID=UPI0020C11E18|nr:neutral zinc metallopeptidase [Aquiflexum sp. TKW24L]MCL6259023.1 neutral zinc metallopeptidase [Aquiflexum sp. TKW24L]